MSISRAAGNAVSARSEAERLRVLRSYAILDTAPESEFDDLAALAAQLFGTPMGLVVFVDEHRQFVKALFGIALTETSRDVAFCEQVVASGDLLVVPDVALDVRFAGNPMLIGGHEVRFFAGAPLVAESGYPIGVICALDSIPRTADERQCEALRRLARQAMILTERRKLLARVSAMSYERAGMEVALLTSTELASRSINAARLGWWAWAMVSDSMTWGGHFEGLLGCEPGGFEGTIGALLARIDDADREQVDARIRLAMLGEDFEGLRFAVPLKDGTKRWLEMCGGLTRALEDSAPRVSGVLRDITREVEAEVRKRREVMLKEKESRLQDAERATRELETFCLAAAHDLRKPLHTISSFGHLLLRDDGARLTTAGQNRLARICAAAERMSEMVEKMLQLGQYGQAGLNPASFSLRDAIEAVLSDLDSPAGVSVEIPERFEVYADLVLIREVIANLVGNAVKYSRTRAEPDIVIGASRQGGEVLVWVRDNGVGFPVEEAHRLFKSFERLHPAQEFEGAGIGLAIVKRVVERHGGRVWARAFEGQGAEFGFGLPQDHQ